MTAMQPLETVFETKMTENPYQFIGSQLHALKLIENLILIKSIEITVQNYSNTQRFTS